MVTAAARIACARSRTLRNTEIFANRMRAIVRAPAAPRQGDDLAAATGSSTILSIVANLPVNLFTLHSRSWLANRYVYPVVSRRSKGLSIGVNLNPDKVCNFDCIYCC